MVDHREKIRDHKKEIIGFLEKIAARGHNASQVFDDWLDLVLAALDALPGHLRNSAQGLPLEDSPETQELWSRIKSRYERTEPAFDLFTKAFGVLLLSTDTWGDVLGDVYMEFGNPSPRAGQFFTPWNVALCMAQMALIDIEKEINERVKGAISRSIEATALLFAGVGIRDQEESRRFFYERLLPVVANDIEPFSICDPCVGSGVMLLAAGSVVPRWALDFGLVRFWGMDIDPTCVKMARINCMIYGLNGFWLRCALDATPEEIAAMPEPYQAGYVEAVEAQSRGDVEKVQEIAFEMRRGQYNFFGQVIAQGVTSESVDQEV